jgi:hypothetical protein
VNDPLVLALSEAAALFPLSGKPDFVISLGTGEPHHADKPDRVSDNTRQKSILRKLGEAFWEKLQDKQVREAIQTRCIPEWYHRFDTALNGFGPRLDDTASMSTLKEQAEGDGSISELIDNAAYSLVASLFYFKLDRDPDRHEGRFVGSGRILCSVSDNDPAFLELMKQLSADSAQFLLDGCPVCSIDDPSCWDKDGNFRKSIEINTTDSFAILLKRQTGTWNISASPFSVDRLIKQQRFKSFFGNPDHQERKASDGPDHRKRKASDSFDLPRTKRRRT